MRRLAQLALTALVLTAFLTPALAAPRVELTWQNPDTLATSISIVRGTGPCGSTALLPVPGSPVAGTATAFTDTDPALADGASYCYSVIAIDATGPAVNNPQVGVTIPFPLPVPAARSNLTAVPAP